MADLSKPIIVPGSIVTKSLPLRCRLGWHRLTENNKLSRFMMLMDTGHPIGCTRCGALFDNQP